MSLTLYHYVHCPFCLRVRLALGFLQLNYHSQVLSYDDEETPLKLTGTKMLPILSYSNGMVMNESLDIIAFLDEDNYFEVKEFMGRQDFSELEIRLAKLGNPVHSLAMPYWIYTPEFTPAARDYFQKKKEAKRGAFKILVKNQNQYISELKPLLLDLEKQLRPFYQASTLTIKDIMIASHLWGLYIVPEFQFSERVHHYLQEIKKLCHFEYHQDFWS